ncbi:MAG: endonuclease III [Calditrichaceae bacterium]|nr:endonuclease III [Calditrichia bacterium]NUQ42615.1 endonuclease III [Calditrichaceae bacterium]
MLTKNKITAVLQVLEAEYGHTGTALKYQNDFQLLVATMLSAQSTDNQVNKITEKLFRECPDAKSFAALSLEDLEEKIKQVGLYRSKARNILAASKMILNDFGGKVPQTLEALTRLPGVGRKTANVVMSTAFAIPAIAVDTHVFRVANRIGLAEAKNELNTELQLQENIPQEKWARAHHWLIWHGRKVCKAQNPRCEICPLRDYCQYFHR